MLRLLSFSLAMVLFSSAAQAADAPADTLGFELPGDGFFTGWYGGPKETQFIDSTVVHSGRFAARMERGPASPSNFSTATRCVPIRFAGKTIELRGWIRMQDVKNGFAGLWMREDSKSKNALQFDNMRDRQLSGTTEWVQYSITLKLDSRADNLCYGALISGEGTIWVDDLELLVDGKPVGEAPGRPVVETAIDKDHEFDSGSKIMAATLSSRQVANLALLGKVWGFVKYHHPRVTAGELSWDYELFRVMPGVVAANSATEAQNVISAWLHRVGAPSPCSPCASVLGADSTHLRPGTDWIRNRKLLGPQLVEQLGSIHTNRSITTAQHYVSFVPGVGNPVFDAERSYDNAPYPDAGYRLLALFRFWNAVEYWFPYRNLIDEKWDAVLDEFIPRFIAAANENEYVLTMVQLVARIDDGHGSVPQAWRQRPPAGECRLPVALRHVQGQFVVSEYIDSTLGANSGIQIGDVLTSIDGQSIKSIVKRVAPYYAFSNRDSHMWVLAYTLTSGECGPSIVEVKRNGKTVAIETAREPLSKMESWDGGPHDLDGPTFRKLSDDVAYLKLSSVKQAETASYIEQASGTKCLIIDIRNYPSEFVPFALGQHLVTKSTPFACFTRGDATHPGAFVWTEPVVIEPKGPHYEGKVAVLVDDASVSQSEYTAMAFRAAGATVIGSTTAGADGNMSRMPLPGGISANFSGIGVFYPDRKPTQQVGIVPDVVVRPTIKGIREGRDEVVETAIKHAIGRELPVASR